MKLLALAALLPLAWASPLLDSRQASVGTGPYPAKYITDQQLPGHTIYLPSDLAAVKDKMPVIVWGNGACSANGLSHHNSNIEMASYGFIVIASGAPNGQGSTTAQTMKDSIDFITKAAGTGTYAKVDASKIAAAGMSCGGLEAYENILDQRVMALGIFNSGQFDAAGTNNIVPKITKPIFYFLGGPTDIAYNNGMRDYAAAKKAWVANLPVGHGGTYGDLNGGKFGKAASHWVRYVLKGDGSVKGYLTNGIKADGWTLEYKGGIV